MTWGAIRTAHSVAVGALTAPLYISQIHEIMKRAEPGGAMPPDVNSMMALQGVNPLISVLGILVTAILSCAVFRSILKPEDRRMTYLRLSASGPAATFS